MVKKMLDWFLNNNYQWILSGIGIPLISFLITKTTKFIKRKMILSKAIILYSICFSLILIVLLNTALKIIFQTLLDKILFSVSILLLATVLLLIFIIKNNKIAYDKLKSEMDKMIAEKNKGLPDLPFDKKLGIFYNEKNSLYYCASCYKKDILSPLKEMAHGWQCQIIECDKFYNNPDYKNDFDSVGIIKEDKPPKW